MWSSKPGAFQPGGSASCLFTGSSAFSHVHSLGALWAATALADLYATYDPREYDVRRQRAMDSGLGARDPCSNTHVKPLRTETLYSTPWFDLVAKTMRPGEAPYYSLRLPDYVGILALTEDRRVILVRQYRPAVEQFTIELPAGLVDPGESPVDAARRELLEETGYLAPEIETIGELSTDTGRLSNRIWACYAPGVHRAPDCRTETGIETLAYSTGELVEMTKGGQFQPALHVAILTLAAARGLITIS